jgi:hypothetical protein
MMCALVVFIMKNKKQQIGLCEEMNLKNYAKNIEIQMIVTMIAR